METETSDALTCVFFPLRHAVFCDFRFLFLLELHMTMV